MNTNINTTATVNAFKVMDAYREVAKDNSYLLNTTTDADTLLKGVEASVDLFQSVLYRVDAVYDMEDVTTDTFVDRDGNVHFIYVPKKVLEDPERYSKFKKSLKVVQENLFGTGKMCHDMSVRTYSHTETAYTFDGVIADYMTVVSILKTIGFGRTDIFLLRMTCEYYM